MSPYFVKNNTLKKSGDIVSDFFPLRSGILKLFKKCKFLGKKYYFIKNLITEHGGKKTMLDIK